MNYKKIYEDLIARTKIINLSEDNQLIEKHHIIPLSLGGSNIQDNMVVLTYRQHFVAHLLLYKMQEKIQNKRKMLCALNVMINSHKYNIRNSHTYEMIRKRWIENHPGKQPDVKKKIIKSLQNFRINNGFHYIECACGCGLIAGVSIHQTQVRYIKEHAPKKFCRCGCGAEILKTLLYNPGHRYIEMECVCGCGGIKKIERSKFRGHDHYIRGHNKAGQEEANKKRSYEMKTYLSNLSKDDLLKRVKNSLLRGDNKKRARAISEGKKSELLLELQNGKSIHFYSYEAEQKTGFNYQHIKYVIKLKGGMLSNGGRIKYIRQYKGGNKWKKKQSLSAT